MRQRGQNRQDSYQDDDQLDEGETLFVFQFFEHLVFLQIFLFYTNISAPCRHFILSFYNTFCALSSQVVLLQLVLCFYCHSQTKVLWKKANLWNLTERLRYLIDCEEIKIKDLPATASNCA